MKIENLFPKQIFTSYIDLLAYVYNTYDSKDEAKADRTKVGRLSVYGACLNIDLSTGDYPLETTREVNPYIAPAEMLWILSGSSNTHDLKQLGGGSIWNKWANKQNEIGPLYGRILRGEGSWCDAFPDGHENLPDQFRNFVHGITTNPTSARLVMSTWNPSYIPEDESVEPSENVKNDKGALAPCHGLVIQAFVHDNAEGTKSLSLQMYQRSADLPVGVVFNIAEYGFLLHMLSFMTGLKPGVLMMRFGDAHIYANQFDLVKEQITRTPYPYPKMKFTEKFIDILCDPIWKNNASGLFSYGIPESGMKASQFIEPLTDYKCHEPIVYDVAK